MKQFLIIIVFSLTQHFFCISFEDNFFESVNKNKKSLIKQVLLNTNLQHLTIDKNTGQIYIGGINIIYQLSSDLEILNVGVTGPKMDSIDCTISECPPNTMKQLTPNINKVLLIDYDSNSLITCGTLFQGICDVRNLQNISIIEPEINEAVVSNTENDSTFAFIGPGPNLKNVMYVGVTFNKNSPYRSEIPAVCSRNLDRKNIFKTVETGTSLYLNQYAREDYLIDYIYGFSSEGFSYFMTTQLKYNLHTIPKKYITKLIRICQSELNYISYTEIPIGCESQSTKYNILSAAYLGKPDIKLATDLKISILDDVLFTVFSESNNNKPTNKSAICIFSLKEIRMKFMENIKKCYSGEGPRGLDYISPNMPCRNLDLQNITENFCGTKVNSPLGGEIPILTDPVIIFDREIKSIVAIELYNYTIVYVGTKDGYLKKVLVDIGNNKTRELEEIIVDENSPINRDMQFDKEKNHLYVMTTNKITKIGLLDCGNNVTVEKCLGARIPYCGWCSFENKCTVKSECLNKDDSSMYWVPYSEFTTLKEIQITKIDLIQKKFLEPQPLTSNFMVTFKETVKTNKFYLSLKHSHLTRIVSNWTINLNFNELHWKIIDFSFNSIYHLDDEIFDDLVDVDTVNLNENLLESLPLGLFDKTTKLLNINLSSNKLKVLNEGVFDKLTQLEYLDLSNNNLSSLPNNIFNKNHDLVEINLSKNQLKKLNFDTFKLTTNLEYLDLSNNFYFDLSSSNSNILTGITSLRILDLSNCFMNKIIEKSFGDLINLQELYLQNNNLNELPKKIFKNLRKLKYLDLSENKFEIISFFDIPLKLKILNLYHNKIKDIQLNEILYLNSLQSLNISFNKLTFLRAEVLEHLKNLNQFETKGNPFQCPCYLELIIWRKLNPDVKEKKERLYKIGKRPVCFVGDTSKCWYNAEINEIYSKVFI